jgi:hypothetical protein
MSGIKESLPVTRLLMVLSGMAPMFLIWAVRGSPSVKDRYFVAACLAFAILPTLVVFLRIRAAKKTNDCQTKVIGEAEDHRDHILVYLFAMLLPFYTANLASGREFASTVVALVFIVFLFWHMNLHYMNLVFAFWGYRVFTVLPEPGNKLSGKTPFVVLTKKSVLTKDEIIETYRLSDTVFIEK